ncbi:Regulator of rDNA transcription protein 15 [Capsicum chinense]|nr:Regulator of rDNA transcription protein 15 [Capsicum chinense]
MHPNAPSMYAQHRPQRPAIDVMRCYPCRHCKAESSTAWHDSPPLGGAKDIKACRELCTGAAHAGRRHSPRIQSKGSLGHAFMVCIRTVNQNQTSVYPSGPQDISVLVELILGHLHYLLTDVPPQPKSPPDNVFRPDRPTERAFGPKRGSEFAIRRARKAPEGTVPSPSPDQHVATRSHCGSCSSIPSTDEGFGTGTLVSTLNANPFPEVTDPFYPLPMPTLFHRPEVVLLGDLMWLSVEWE